MLLETSSTSPTWLVPQMLLKINPQTLLKINPQTLLESDPRVLLTIGFTQNWPTNVTIINPTVLLESTQNRPTRVTQNWLTSVTQSSFTSVTQNYLELVAQTKLRIDPRVLLEICSTNVTQD